MTEDDDAFAERISRQVDRHNNINKEDFRRVANLISKIAQIERRIELLEARSKNFASFSNVYSEKLKMMAKTLKFYADSRNYGEGNGLSWEAVEFWGIGEDRGERARQTLKATGWEEA